MATDNKNLLETYLNIIKGKKGIKNETLESYKREIELFIDFIYPESILTQTEYGIFRYIKELESRYQDLSVRKKIIVIKGFYKELLKKGLIDINPLEEIKYTAIPRIKEENITMNQVNHIISFCEKNPKGIRDEILINLLIESGEKINDLLKIEMKDIINYQEINILKKDGIIKIEITSELSIKLRNFINVERGKINEENKKLLFQNLSRQNFRARFKKYCTLAGIEEEITPGELKSLSNSKTKLEEEEKIKNIKEIYIKIGIGDD